MEGKGSEEGRNGSGNGMMNKASTTEQKQEKTRKAAQIGQFINISTNFVFWPAQARQQGHWTAQVSHANALPMPCQCPG